MSKLSLRTIFYAWLPLLSTWVLMACEGPFIHAITARLEAPKENLAAFGLAFSILLIIESPVFMLLAGSTSLVDSKQAYERFRNFAIGLSFFLSIVLAICFMPFIFYPLAVNLLSIPKVVADIALSTAPFIIPLPFAVGYRRFYQGVLVRYNLAGRVAQSTFIRLVAMTSTGLYLFSSETMSGAQVAFCSAMAGILLEAVAVRLFVRRALRKLYEEESGTETSELRYSKIISFYYPLALAGVVSTAVPPFVTFFLARSPMELESLAVYPVISGFAFLFKACALASQEVIIAKIGDGLEHRSELKQFMIYLGVGLVGLWAIVCFSPLGVLWFESICGLPENLANLAILSGQIMILIPASTTWQVWLRALCIKNHTTRVVTISTIAELTLVVLTMLLLVYSFDMIGVLAAAVALVVGRTLGSVAMLFPEHAKPKG